MLTKLNSLSPAENAPDIPDSLQAMIAQTHELFDLVADKDHLARTNGAYVTKAIGSALDAAARSHDRQTQDMILIDVMELVADPDIAHVCRRNGKDLSRAFTPWLDGLQPETFDQLDMDMMGCLSALTDGAVSREEAATRTQRQQAFVIAGTDATLSVARKLTIAHAVGYLSRRQGGTATSVVAEAPAVAA